MSELVELQGIVSNENMKCIHCIEKYVQLDDAQKTPEAWAEVKDAVTVVPSWQMKSFGPGQMIAACVTVFVCLDHIQMNQPTAEEIATRSGLALPGQN